MIFKPELVRLVLRGLKTETRRKVKPGQHDCRYRPQHTYAIQRPVTKKDRQAGVRGRAVTIEAARLVVTDVSHQLLADIDRAAAIREGFPNEIHFAHYWMRLYERRWPEQEEQICPRCDGFATVHSEPCPNDCDLGTVMGDRAYSDNETWQRFLTRHGDTAVWAVRFELEQDPLRLLAPTTRPHGSEHGYTTETFAAMSDEPEAIDPARIHKDWRTRTQAHHVASLQSTDGARLAGLRTDEERLAELRAMAAERQVDIRDDINARRRRIEDVDRRTISAIERKIRDKTDGRAA